MNEITEKNMRIRKLGIYTSFNTTELREVMFKHGLTIEQLEKLDKDADKLGMSLNSVCELTT